MKTVYLFLGVNGKKYSYTTYLLLSDFVVMEQASVFYGMDMVEIVSKKSVYD